MIVLDTHAWLWWHRSSGTLSPKALQAIQKAVDQKSHIGISAISCWEVAMLVAKGRLGLAGDVEEWINKSLSLPEMRFLELNPSIAVLSTRLEGLSTADPADKIILATAKFHNCPLVTKDRAMNAYPHVETIWN